MKTTDFSISYLEKTLQVTKKITGVTCYFKIEPAKARRYWIDNVIVEEIPNV